MYGVILWSDHNAKKAVIWCEDHGKLAYFNPAVDENDSTQGGESMFGVGDLIKFQVSDWCTVRRASKVQLIAAAQFPGLAGGLTVARSELNKKEQMAGLGNVISFRKAPRCGQTVSASA